MVFASAADLPAPRIAITLRTSSTSAVPDLLGGAGDQGTIMLAPELAEPDTAQASLEREQVDDLIEEIIVFRRHSTDG